LEDPPQNQWKYQTKPVQELAKEAAVPLDVSDLFYSVGM
jgi:hypothetical protein